MGTTEGSSPTSRRRQLAASRSRSLGGKRTPSKPSHPGGRGRNCRKLEMMKSTFKTCGHVKEIKQKKGPEGKGDRIWRLVKFQEGHQIRVKQWNHEADFTKRQRDGTDLGKLADDVKYKFKNAQWRLQGATLLDNAKVGEELELKFSKKPSEASHPGGRGRNVGGKRTPPKPSHTGGRGRNCRKLEVMKDTVKTCGH